MRIALRMAGLLATSLLLACDSDAPQQTACGASNCAGCCDAAGVCQPGNAAAECGAAGSACASCEGSTVCNDGACVVSSCNAATCPDGCCDTAGVCQRGDTLTSCGSVGNACASCDGSEVCSGGACVPPSCNAATCPDGCCDSSGVCHAGSTAEACGSAGAACVSCASPSVCNEGTCERPACNATSCPDGCCDAVGACQAGNTNAACGSAGEACESCDGSDVCRAGACVPSACNALTCPDGCCDGFGACQAGNTSAACGTAANACATCTEPSVCNAGACAECEATETQREACGNCGTHSRSCTSALVWGDWSACSDEGECAVGAVDSRTCNMTGTQERTCGGACAWEPWGTCSEVLAITWRNVVAKGTNYARRVQAQGSEIWVGTTGGLLHSSDAGSTWDAFTTSDGLGGSSISALLVVGDSVFVGSNGGLTYSLDRGASWTNLTTADGLAGNTVRVIRRASDGSLWIGTNGGASHWSPQGAWSTFTTASGLADNDVVDIAIAPNGSVWLAHDALVNMSGLSVTTDGGQTWAHPSEPGPRNPVKAVFVDSAGVVWVSTWIDGVYRSADQGATWTPIAASAICTSSSCFVQTFFEYPNGTLWLGTQGNRPSGVSITSDSGATWTKRVNLNNLYALGIAGNGEGRVYVATYGGGLDWTEDQGASWTAIPTQLGIPENEVTAVSRGPAGSIWLGTLQTYAAYSTDGGNTWTNVLWPYLGSLSNSVQGLWFDEVTGTMWIATGNGLFSTSDMGATFGSASTTNGLGANDVRGVFGSHVGGQMVLWAATGSGSDDGNGGLSKSLDGITWTNYRRDNTQYGSNNTFAVFVDSTGKVWGATNSGLRFSSDQGAHWTTWLYRLNLGLPVFEFRSVWVEDDGTLWIGADRFNTPVTMAKSSDGGSTWMTWSITTPTGAETVGTVVTKDPVTGAVFVGTDQAGLYWTFDGGSSWTGASTTDGLGSNQINGVAASSNGDIFVATDRGLGIGSPAP